jgi:hypothetical protein
MMEQQAAEASPIQLAHEWVFYFDEPSGKGLERKQYEDSLKPLGSCGTVQVPNDELQLIFDAQLITKACFAGVLALLEQHRCGEVLNQLKPSFVQKRHSTELGG